MKSIAFGEILYDVIEDNPYLGGAPLNFAIHLAKAGGESHIISKVGNDDLGRNALEEIKKQGVGTRYIGTDESLKTGTVEVVLDEGQPDYLIHEDVAFDNITVDQVPENFDETHIFYFGTLVQRSEQSRETLYKILDFTLFEFVFYDVNLRKDCYSKETIHRSFGYANIIKLNRNEVSTIGTLLFGEELNLEGFLEKCKSTYSPKIIIVTDGANGCYIFEEGKINHVPGTNITVKDTIGAGDSFSAAFMYKYFRTRDALISAATANKVGAFVASQQGAIPEYSPTIQQQLHR
jgi:fructokinase